MPFGLMCTELVLELCGVEDGEEVDCSTHSFNVEDQFAAIKLGFANHLQSEESVGCEQEKEKLSVKEASLTQACTRWADVAEATAMLSTIKASCGVPSTDVLIAEKTKSDSSKRSFKLDSNLKEGSLLSYLQEGKVSSGT